MKARTKAARRKRGRPRLPAVAREPNGAKSRRIESRQQQNDESERDAMNVAVNARLRQFGIVGKNAASALDPRFGYELGRLMVLGHVTGRQHEAGTRFAEDMGRFYMLAGVAFPSARAQELGRVAGEAGESDSKAEAAARATAKAKRLQGLLLTTGSMQEGRDTMRVVMGVCVQDLPLSRSTRELFLLRRGLNRLVGHYAGKG